MADSTTANVTDMTEALMADSYLKTAYFSHYWEQILTAVITGIIAIIGLISNPMILAAVAFSKKLWTPTNAFVTSLAVADLLTSFALIWYTVSALGRGEWLLGPKACWLCQFTAAMINIAIGTSMWTLGIIAVNRLILILKPYWYKKIFSSSKLGTLVAIPWIIPVASLIVTEATGHATFGYDKLSAACVESKRMQEAIFARSVVGLLFPLPAIIVSYTWIYTHVKRHFQAQRESLVRSKSQQLQISNKKIELEITKNLFMIFCAFFVCFLPYFILQSVQNIVNVEHYLCYAKMGPFANSAINFLIYASKHPDFKIILRCMMKCSYADIPQPSPLLKHLRKRRQTPRRNPVRVFVVDSCSTPQQSKGMHCQICVHSFNSGQSRPCYASGNGVAIGNPMSQSWPEWSCDHAPSWHPGDSV